MAQFHSGSKMVLLVRQQLGLIKSCLNNGINFDGRPKYNEMKCLGPNSVLIVKQSS